MKPAQITARATFALLVAGICGCELVLGELPTPAEDLSTTESTTSTVNTTSSNGGGGGTGGDGDGGTGGVATTSSSNSTSTGGAGGSTSTSSTGQGGCCDECDCDCDGFPAEGACAGTGTADCDDTSDKVYPDEPIYYVEASPNNGFDWDCSGAPVRDPDLDDPVDCAALLGIGCNQKTGFLGKTAPMCGEAGTWGTCKKSGLECLPDPIEEGKKMPCK